MDAVTALVELGGVATLVELLSLTTERRLRTAVGRGHVLRCGRARYALASLAAHRLAAERAGGVTSHESAAIAHGWKVRRAPERPVVTVPRQRHRPHGVEPFWADLGTSEVADGVTVPLRTVLDCARHRALPDALAVADSALRVGAVGQQELLRAAEETTAWGRTRVLRVARLADGRADNPFESVLRAHASGVVGLDVEPQQWVGDAGRADLVDRRLGLVVEADSWEYHGNRPAFDRDVRRYTAFTALGYGVARFGWWDAMFDAEGVEQSLAALVAVGPFPAGLRPRRA